LGPGHRAVEHVEQRAERDHDRGGDELSPGREGDGSGDNTRRSDERHGVRGDAGPHQRPTGWVERSANTALERAEDPRHGEMSLSVPGLRRNLSLPRAIFRADTRSGLCGYL